MACISKRPGCRNPEDSVPDPLSKIGGLIGLASLISGFIGFLLDKASEVPEIAKFLGLESAGGVFSPETLAGIFVGVGTAIVVLAIIVLFYASRCDSIENSLECVAGVVHEIVQDFSSITEEIFPFTAMHDRVDIIVKSKYWQVVESGNPKRVFCTDETIPRRSVIMRCYYYTDRVCKAARGALAGAILGAFGGAVNSILAAAAIGCAAGPIFCLLAIIVAMLIAATATLVGAFVGGQIAKASSDDTTPTNDDKRVISVGDLISVTGNMLMLDNDEGANVLWWVKSTSPCGKVPDSTPNNPFSYCEIDDIFEMDECPNLIE